MNNGIAALVLLGFCLGIIVVARCHDREAADPCVRSELSTVICTGAGGNPPIITCVPIHKCVERVSDDAGSP